MKYTLLIWGVLFSGCNTIPCEEDLTRKMSDCLPTEAEVRAKKKQFEDAILWCEGRTNQKCEYITPGESKRRLRAMQQQLERQARRQGMRR